MKQNVKKKIFAPLRVEHCISGKSAHKNNYCNFEVDIDSTTFSITQHIEPVLPATRKNGSTVQLGFPHCVGKSPFYFTKIVKHVII